MKFNVALDEMNLKKVMEYKNILVEPGWKELLPSFLLSLVDQLHPEDLWVPIRKTYECFKYSKNIIYVIISLC